MSEIEVNIEKDSSKIKQNMKKKTKKKNKIILGMTGSRSGMSDLCKDKLLKFLRKHNIIECHHGDCVGADEEFHNIVQEKKIKIIVHPSTYTSYRAFCIGNTVLPPSDYLSRNRSIVDSCDMLIAFPYSTEELTRSGTWYTVRYARLKHKKIIIIHSDGNCIKENW